MAINDGAEQYVSDHLKVNHARHRSIPLPRFKEQKKHWNSDISIHSVTGFYSQLKNEISRSSHQAKNLDLQKCCAIFNTSLDVLWRQSSKSLTEKHTGWCIKGVPSRSVYQVLW